MYKIGDDCFGFASQFGVGFAVWGLEFLVSGLEFCFAVWSLGLASLFGVWGLEFLVFLFMVCFTFCLDAKR